MIRKIIIFVDIVIVLCFLLSLNPGVREKIDSINYDTSKKQATIDVTFIKDEGIEDISVYQDAIASIPYDIIVAFKNESWSIYIKNDLDDSGLTDYSEKIIYINGSEKGQEKNTLIHEFGHFEDYITSSSSNEDFLDLYNKYKDSYVEYDYLNLQNVINNEESHYAASNEREFFAICFKDYLLHNTYIKDTYPELFTYYKILLKQ